MSEPRLSGRGEIAVNVPQIGETQDEADGIQNVGLTTAVGTRNRVELGVERPHVNALSVALEALDGDLFDVHREGPWREGRWNAVALMYNMSDCRLRES